MNEKNNTCIDRFKFSLREVLLVGGMACAALFNYASASTRISTLEVEINQINSRYEREVVPRGEHIEMNRRLEDRLHAIEVTLSEIQVDMRKNDLLNRGK